MKALLISFECEYTEHRFDKAVGKIKRVMNKVDDNGNAKGVFSFNDYAVCVSVTNNEAVATVKAK